jgi:protein phosphatase PTC1
LLAVTRSFGDFYLKPYVSVKPFSSSLKLGKTDKFIILACDGLWDVCEDQKAVDLIMKETNPDIAAQTLLQYALDNNSTDNLSVMVVLLDH